MVKRVPAYRRNVLSESIGCEANHMRRVNRPGAVPSIVTPCVQRVSNANLRHREFPHLGFPGNAVQRGASFGSVGEDVLASGAVR